MPDVKRLLDKIETRQAVVSIIGLGYVGLPLAVVFAEAGFRVFGIDVDKGRVGSVNRGESYIQDLPSEALIRLVLDAESPLDEKPLLPNGRPCNGLSATTEYSVLHNADIAVICVPTPLNRDRDPDVSYILAAADGLAENLHRGMLVVMESTTYPGTTNELILSRLQEAADRSLKVGTDFFLAFSPERIDPGRTDWTIVNTPKVVGGVTPRCRHVAEALYGCIVQEVVPVSSPTVAEMVKLLENTFRATNIALVNELMIMCDRLGIDAYEVIEAAKTKPFGYVPFYPGPGVGGHCIPIDPRHLAWKMKTLDYHARMIQLAEEINSGMPLYWVSKVQDALSQRGKSVEGSKILVLGVTYKRNVGDIRESPALEIIHHLKRKGANVIYHDPYVPVVETGAYKLTSMSDLDLPRGVIESDCVVIATDHSSYEWGRIRESASVIIDTRNALGGLSSM